MTTKKAERVDINVLNEQIKKFAAQPRYENKTAGVEFPAYSIAAALFEDSTSFEQQKLEGILSRVNSALGALGQAERQELATALLELWCRGTKEEIRAVLGDSVDLRPNRGAMFTLSGNGRQLRVWYSFPGRIEFEHVESGGVGLLMHIGGHPEIVERYLTSFLGVMNLAEARGQEGARIYVGF